MEDSAFRGKLVWLTEENPEVIAGYITRWNRDSEYWRLSTSDPSRMFSPQKVKEWIEKDMEKEPSNIFNFAIRTLAEDRLIGFIGLDGVNWNHGDAFVGIGIGERELWGKGYGTDAMRIILGYAFRELNLHRLTLDVFEYNPRAVRSYEKAGFKVEGRARKMLHREGRRWDLIYMGILKEEWEHLEEK
ncbi:MAG: GNAT family N-acetyltransferase [Omnitrophica WOR_2 bacterium]